VSERPNLSPLFGLAIVKYLRGRDKASGTHLTLSEQGLQKG